MSLQRMLVLVLLLGKNGVQAEENSRKQPPSLFSSRSRPLPGHLPSQSGKMWKEIYLRERPHQLSLRLECDTA